MKLTEGMKTVRLRRLSWHWRRANGQGRMERFISAKTLDALAWAPGPVPGKDGYEIWAAHTEEQLKDRYAEQLTRGAA